MVSLTRGTVSLDSHILSDRFSNPVFGEDKINNESFRQPLSRSKRFVMMRAHFTCRHMNDLRGFGLYFSLSLIPFFRATFLLLLGRLLIFFVLAETYLLLVVV